MMDYSDSTPSAEHKKCLAFQVATKKIVYFRLKVKITEIPLWLTSCSLGKSKAYLEWPAQCVVWNGALTQITVIYNLYSLCKSQNKYEDALVRFNVSSLEKQREIIYIKFAIKAFKS